MKRDYRKEARVARKLFELLPEGPFKDRIGMGRFGPLGVGPKMILLAAQLLRIETNRRDYPRLHHYSGQRINLESEWYIEQALNRE